MKHRAMASACGKKLGVKNVKYNLNEAIGSYTYKDNTGYHIEPTRKLKK